MQVYRHLDGQVMSAGIATRSSYKGDLKTGALPILPDV